MCLVAGRSGAGILVFFTSGFHRFVCDEACQFRNQQSRTLVIVATMVLSGTRGPWLFLVIREGLGSRVRLGARGTQRLTNQLRLALEPECFENPTATVREDHHDRADSVKDTQAVCGFRCWASKHTPLFHTINTIVAIFLAKVRRAISGLIPLATKAV
jgi:hypothetical protein